MKFPSKIQGKQQSNFWKIHPLKNDLEWLSLSEFSLSYSCNLWYLFPTSQRCIARQVLVYTRRVVSPDSRERQKYLNDFGSWIWILLAEKGILNSLTVHYPLCRVDTILNSRTLLLYESYVRKNRIVVRVGIKFHKKLLAFWIQNPKPWRDRIRGSKQHRRGLLQNRCIQMHCCTPTQSLLQALSFFETSFIGIHGS